MARKQTRINTVAEGESAKRKRYRISEATEKKICEEIKKGRTLVSICKDEGMPSRSTLYLHREENLDFAKQFAAAEEIGLEAVADEMREIADDRAGDTVTRDRGKAGIEKLPNAANVQRDKLRVDTRARVLAAKAPRVWGNKQTTEYSGSVLHQVEDITQFELARRLSFLIDQQSRGPVIEHGENSEPVTNDSFGPTRKVATLGRFLNLPVIPEPEPETIELEEAPAPAPAAKQTTKTETEKQLPGYDYTHHPSAEEMGRENKTPAVFRGYEHLKPRRDN